VCAALGQFTSAVETARQAKSNLTIRQLDIEADWGILQVVYLAAIQYQTTGIYQSNKFKALMAEAINKRCHAAPDAAAAPPAAPFKVQEAVDLFQNTLMSLEAQARPYWGPDIGHVTVKDARDFWTWCTIDQLTAQIQSLQQLCSFDPFPPGHLQYLRAHCDSATLFPCVVSVINTLNMLGVTDKNGSNLRYKLMMLHVNSADELMLSEPVGA